MNDQSIKILLIEDDEDDYIILKDLVSMIGIWKCIIDWAPTADLAFEKLGASDYDICLLDYRLGQFNGIELLDILRKKNFHVPVIILTGQGDHDTDLEAMEHGAVDYLEKAALNPVLLERTIRYAINTSNIVTALKRSEEKLHILSGKILEAQEEERKSLALELHDSIGSGLAGILFVLEQKIESIESSSGSDQNSGSLEQIRAMIKDIIDETQRISTNLRPSILDSLGLLPALRSLCKKFKSIYSDIELFTRLDIDEEDVPEKLKITIYRIVQESLNNAAKYSEARNLKLSICRDRDYLVLDVEDDGKGFNPENAVNGTHKTKSMGIEGMIERASLAGGELSIDTGLGKGTAVRARFLISSQVPF